MFSWLRSVYCPCWSMRTSKPWPVSFLSCSRNRDLRQARWEDLEEAQGWFLPLWLQDARLCPRYSSCTKWGGCCGYKLQSNLWKSVLSPASLVFQTQRNTPVLSLVVLPLELASEESAEVWHRWQQLLRISTFPFFVFILTVERRWILCINRRRLGWLD